MTISLFGYLLMYNFEQFLSLSLNCTSVNFQQINKIFLIKFNHCSNFLYMFVWCFLSGGGLGFEKSFQIGF